jgi:hypothetical protein
MIHDEINNEIANKKELNTKDILNYIIEDIENNNIMNVKFYYNSKESLNLYKKLKLKKINFKI